jgi:hypothetical protein
MKLKQTIFITSFTLASASLVMAQTTDGATSPDYVRPPIEQPRPVSNNVISFGFGMGGYYPYTGTNYVSNPNLTLQYENTLFGHAGPGKVNVGALLSYKSIYSSYTDYYSGYNYQQRWNYYIIGSRVSYHLIPFFNKSLETYAGGMIGYYITAFKFNSNDPNTSEPSDPGYFLTGNNSPNFFALSVFAGVRSWFNNHTCVWVELGYGYSSLAFGVSYKI